jgi:hypothetical protein
LLDQPAVQHKLEARPSAEAESARRLVLAAVAMAIFMSAVNISIVATAMPTIVAALGGFRLFSWTFAAYLLAQAVTIPIYGRLADLYGRKRVVLAGVSLFVLGSGLCGLAWDMVPLILFRGLQGAGAGAVLPIATTIVGDLYRPAERANDRNNLLGLSDTHAGRKPVRAADNKTRRRRQLRYSVSSGLGLPTWQNLGAPTALCRNSTASSPQGVS